MPTTLENTQAALDVMVGDLEDADVEFVRNIRFEKRRGFTTEELARLDRVMFCLERIRLVRSGKFEPGKGVGEEVIEKLRGALGLNLANAGTTVGFTVPDFDTGRPKEPLTEDERRELLTALRIVDLQD